MEYPVSSELKTLANLSPTLLLTPGEWQKICTCFCDKKTLLNHYEHTSGFIKSLRQMDFPDELIRTYVLRIQELDGEKTSFTDYYSIQESLDKLLNSFSEQQVKISPDILDLLVDSVITDDCLSYSEISDNENLTNTFLHYQNTLTTTNLDQREFITALKLRKLFKNTNGSIGLSAKSGTVSIESNNTINGVIRTDLFKNRELLQFARIGPVFLLNLKSKSIISPDTIEHSGCHFIYIDDLNKTEFRSRLGYFTFNTISSLTQVDFSGAVVIDCGTGCGVLPLVTQALGAFHTIGIDFDKQSIEIAKKNAQVNQLSDKTTFLEADLRHTESISKKVSTICRNKPVIIISNIGHWPDYPITNITNYKLAWYLRQQGLNVSQIISGGFSCRNARLYGDESTFIDQIGISIDPTSYKDSDFDTQVLQKLGYHTYKTLTSQRYKSWGQVDQAQSLIVFG